MVKMILFATVARTCNFPGFCFGVAQFPKGSNGSPGQA